MNRKPLKSGLALAVVVASLGLAAGAQARIPVEPGPGSPVAHHQGRVPAKQHSKKSTKRQEGGFPVASGTHVKSQAEARTE
ncbi:MAG TPA: hypothetical protein VHS03_06860 [Gaiellaceae bacterium]|nr:hypothetical protein [Gaiellaceae bacterium]